MDILEERDEDSPKGTPAWMATFADLMSLLMCFFVLLLSFSEMDLHKYKQVAGSMEKAFGVQNQTKVMDIPKGTSVIAQEFSPGKTAPTVMDTVQQVSMDTLHKSLRVGNPEAPDLDIEELDEETTRKLLHEQLDHLMEQTAIDAAYLSQILAREIEEGMIDIEYEDRHITIRVRERGSFPSASATLATDFIPVMAAIRNALVKIRGTISVEGHTDSIPISTRNFRSNWDLSASRALSVVQELLKYGKLAPDRFMLVGYAATKPYAPNDSADNRALNRRVEIIIRQSFDEAADATEVDILESEPSSAEVEDPLAANAVP